MNRGVISPFLWKAGHINRWLAANCFGDYYTRKGLDLAQRELITFCFLMAQGGCEPQLIAHKKIRFLIAIGQRLCTNHFRIYQTTTIFSGNQPRRAIADSSHRRRYNRVILLFDGAGRL